MTSQINPNDIDGNYPVAGVDNNSQGFRDNFTNTKSNFQYAANEITDLQNKAILKSALTGQTLDNDMAGNIISAAQIRGFVSTVINIAETGGSVELDYSAGHYQTMVVTYPTSLSFSNFPVGKYGLMRLQLYISDIQQTVELPAAVSLGLSGIQGANPGTGGVSNTISFASPGYYEFAFGSSDGGYTITVFDLNRALINSSNIIVTPGTDRTLLQSTAPQAIFDSPTSGSLTLLANTTYQMDGLYFITNDQTPSASHSISLLFSVAGSLTSIGYSADVTTSSGAPSTGSTTVSRSFSTSASALQITPTSTTTSSEYVIVRLSGIVRSNAGGAFIPQIQYNTNAPGGTSLILDNSWFRMTALGTGTFVSAGNWN